jgi:hypothetical protein
VAAVAVSSILPPSGGSPRAPVDGAPLDGLPSIVVVHGAAHPELTAALWGAGYRPASGTSGPTIWLPLAGAA